MPLEAPPPSRHISSAPISQHDASALLDTYLNNSKAHAYLHPNALITTAGVVFSSHGGPSGGVLMHNLRRVAAGLRGEYLEPEATPEPEEEAGGGKPAWKGKGKGKGRKGQGEWQDAESMAVQEGGVVVGEIGDRTNVVVDGDEEPEVQATNGDGEEAGKKRKQDDGMLTKEERKKAKKERDQKRKRENEKQRAKKAE